MTKIDRLLVLRAMVRLSHRILASLFGAISFISIAAAYSSSAAAFDQAYAYRRLHSFCSKDNCRDGSDPQTALVMDPSGNLYGTTLNGGGVYESKLEQQRRRFQVIYRFCANRNCRTGAAPAGNLIIDSNGNLYGTTAYGGEANEGTVFKLSPDMGRTKWKITTLYDFCMHGNGCADGKGPFTGLTYPGAAAGQAYDGTAPLYGTTQSGGANNYGTVFELDPPEQGEKWSERVLYSFCSQAYCKDGSLPAETPTADFAGNVYGSTAEGGTYGRGIVYELSSRLPGKAWAETVLHNFQYGVGSFGSPLLDASGDLYDAAGGGKHGEGVFFELVRGSKWKLRTLYSFCAREDCADGAGAQDVVMDRSGDFYGVAGSLPGGVNGGTAFELIPDGLKWKLSVLYAFCSRPKCADGYLPITVTLDSHGNVFGTTETGGKNGKDGAGVSFELRAHQAGN